MEGARFEFVAFLQGDPEPTICWLKNGIKVLENPPNNRIYYANGYATFSIENVHTDDTGDYRIRAENVHGAAESWAFLQVIDDSLLGIFYPLLKIEKSTYFVTCFSSKESAANNGKTIRKQTHSSRST